MRPSPLSRPMMPSPVVILTSSLFNKGAERPRSLSHPSEFDWLCRSRQRPVSVSQIRPYAWVMGMLRLFRDVIATGEGSLAAPSVGVIEQQSRFVGGRVSKGHCG